MFAIDLFLKNGGKIEGLIWSWKPEKGWFEALNETDGQVYKYYIKDIQDGKVYPDRDRVQDQARSFLDYAKNEGYNV